MIGFFHCHNTRSTRVTSVSASDLAIAYTRRHFSYQLLSQIAFFWTHISMICIPRSCDYNINVHHVQPPLMLQCIAKMLEHIIKSYKFIKRPILTCSCLTVSASHTQCQSALITKNAPHTSQFALCENPTIVWHGYNSDRSAVDLLDHNWLPIASIAS